MNSVVMTKFYLTKTVNMLLCLCKGTLDPKMISHLISISTGLLCRARDSHEV